MYGMGTGGKSMKTGMVLTHTKLPESASGAVVLHNRQGALVGRTSCPMVEKVTLCECREQAVGAASTKDVPKKKQEKKSASQKKQSSAEHRKEFGMWQKYTYGMCFWDVVGVPVWQRTPRG